MFVLSDIYVQNITKQLETALKASDKWLRVISAVLVVLIITAMVLGGTLDGGHWPPAHDKKC